MTKGHHYELERGLGFWQVMLCGIGIILGAGIYNFYNPPDVKLANLHAGVWWGALLLVLGLVYTLKFAPSRGK